MADIVLLFILKGRDCMSKVLIEVLIIILIAGSYLILYSAVRVSAIADQRIAEIQKRETFDKEKQLNTNQSSISGGMVMQIKKRRLKADWATTVKMADMDCWYQIYGNISDSIVENAWKSRLMTNG